MTEERKPSIVKFGTISNVRLRGPQSQRPKWKLQLQQHRASLAYKASVDKKHKEEAER